MLDNVTSEKPDTRPSLSKVNNLTSVGQGKYNPIGPELCTITTKPQDMGTLSNFPAANFCYDQAPVTEDWGNLMDHGTESDHGMGC